MRNALTQDAREVADQLAEASATVPLGGRIIAAAEAPDHARAPAPGLVLASGLLTGLVAGLGLAAARDRAVPRLRQSTDITDRTGVPVLAVIRRGPQRDHDLTRLANLVLAEAERPGAPVHTFLVAATSPRVRDVAHALEQRLRSSGRATTLLPTPPPLLARVPSQQSAAFTARVGDALHRSDILLLDAKAPGTGSLPPLMADGVIAVVDLGDTSPDRLASALAQLHRDHHRVTGVVAVEPSSAVRARPPADSEDDHVR
jgi:hypothetical protein